MLKRQVPDWEGFKLGISCLTVSYVFVVKLRKTGCQFSGASSGSGNHNKRFGNLNIRICAITLFAYNCVHVCGIAFGEEMLICFYASLFQLVYKDINSRLVFITGDHYAVNAEIVLSKGVDKTHHFQIVSNAKIVSRFIGGDIPRINADNNFRLVLHTLQEFYLCIFVKTRKDSHGVFVVNQLAAKFQIKSITLAAFDSLEYISGLLFDIFLRIKALLQFSASFTALSPTLFHFVLHLSPEGSRRSLP